MRSEERENVTIFWDLDAMLSSSAAMSVSTYEVVHNIRTAVAKYGPLKSFRVYWDHAGYSLVASATQIRSQLSSSGVTLIDCPGEGRRAAAIKKMIVDMVLHAWDHSVPQTFVVITSDRDAAYAISMLRMRDYRVILISPGGTHEDLTMQASSNLDWTKTILGIDRVGLDSDREDFFKEKRAPDSPAPRPTSNPPTSNPPSTGRPFSFTFQHQRGNSGAQGQSYDSPSVELNHIQPSSRRESLFSKPYNAGLDMFGNLEGGIMASPKTMPSFEFADGSSFHRPEARGNQSRSDSAPPKIGHPNRMSVPSANPRRQTGDFDAEPAEAPYSKGKKYEFEPEDIVLQAPLGPGTNPPYSGPIFEPFGKEEPYLQSVTPPSPPIAGTRWESNIRQVSSEGSEFTIVHHLEPSTALKFAEHGSDQLRITDNKPAQPATDATLVSAPSPTIVSSSPPAKISTIATGQCSVGGDFSTSIVTLEKVSDKAIKTLTPPVIAAKQSRLSIALPVSTAPTLTPTPKKSNTASSTIQTTPLSKSKKLQTASTSVPKPPNTRQSTPLVGSSSTATLKAAPPAPWALLVKILRQEGGRYLTYSLSNLLGKADPNYYRKGGFGKYKRYVDAAVKAGIVTVSSIDHPHTSYMQLTATYA